MMKIPIPVDVELEFQFINIMQPGGGQGWALLASHVTPTTYTIIIINMLDFKCVLQVAGLVLWQLLY